MRFVRKTTAVREGRTGYKITATHQKINEGLLPPLVKLGPRASAFIEEELDAVQKARAAGADDDAIRKLVRQLVAARTTASAA